MQKINKVQNRIDFLKEKKQILEESIKATKEANEVLNSVHKENLFSHAEIRKNSSRAIRSGITSIEEEENELIQVTRELKKLDMELEIAHEDYKNRTWKAQEKEAQNQKGEAWRNLV